MKASTEKKGSLGFLEICRKVGISGLILATCYIPGSVQQVLQLSESPNANNLNQEIQPATTFPSLATNRRVVLLCISPWTEN